MIIKNENRKSKLVMNNIRSIMVQSPKNLWKSLTLDRGSGFMDFYSIERKHRCSIYFGDAYSPWPKGSNENFNGRLRKFLPRNTPSDFITEKALKNIQKQMNNTPRKCLDFMTPQETILADCKNLSLF